MNITVLGATGNTGKAIIKKALLNGHTVKAVVRDPQRMDIEDNNLEVVVGDVFKPETLTDILDNQDSVVIALGAGQALGKTTVRTDGTKAIVELIKKTSVKRIVAISAMGTGESWKYLSLINKLFYMTLLKNSRIDHEGQESIIKKSGLDWTIIRPSGLTDGKTTYNYKVGEEIKSNKNTISREDVANEVIISLEGGNHINQAVTITY